ncbi:g2971 [Coccomyxa elongata]
MAREIPRQYPAWVRSPEETAVHYGVDVDGGLTSQQVEQQRAKFGWNELEKPPGKPLWKLVLEQFDDMLVKVLLLAAIVSFFLALFEEGSSEEGIRAFIEPAVILLILILNAIVGVWQESNAEAALDALKDSLSETATVLRNGQLVSELPSRELVPGDVVELHVGDRVPADIRVVALKTATLRAEQASLTGESVAVLKSLGAVAEEGCELQAKDCMLFAGTAVANGTCRGIVNAIGMSTEVGAIQQQITDAAAEEEDTPLKKKLDIFGERLAQVIFAICVLVWVINYHHFLSWDTVKGSTWIPDLATIKFSLNSCIYYFKIAVALAVAAIPEGLPAVITTCLALGTRKMAKRNAIVRKLPSVETLGCTTVICSDKTGTLTTNQMSVVQLIATGSSETDMRHITVEGTSFNPTLGGVVGVKALDRSLEAIAEVCAVCNEARIESKEGVFRAAGAPTEAALVVLAEKLGIPNAQQSAAIAAARKSDPDAHADGVQQWYCAKWRKLATLEFDRNRKSMSVICASPSATPASSGVQTRRTVRASGGNVLLVKGAAESLLERSTQVLLEDGSVVALTEPAKKKIMAAVDAMAARALRCLAFAQKTELGDFASYDGDTSHPAHKQLLDPVNYADIESGLTWLGVAGLIDPPRPEVKGAIEDCVRAGIRVVVITGDNKLTAEAICRKIGVFGDEETDLEGKSLTGRQFVELPLEKRRAILEGEGGRCFSRAEPRHKQDIVRLLKEMGQVVAMTGDGVNDAPALKLADIGVAMGIAGTEVAKEASDMVLADDNFSTIVAAVEEGRAIYNNMKAFIRYMISSNIGEVASIFLTAALGLPENLIPVQLLWVNLVTDGPPATALGFNPPDVDIMQKPPRKSTEELVTPWLFFRWMLVGAYVGFATVGVFCAWYMFDSFLGIDLSGDNHTTVTWHQLRNWESCHTWSDFKATPYLAGGRVVNFAEPCDYFREGKAKASTLSLSVLVAIEMFNALNALSEDNSLLQMPPWCNPWLLVAMALSFGLHFIILYVPMLASIFSIVPLSLNEWALVLLFASPVVIIDEALKFVGRTFVNPRTELPAINAARKKKDE